MFDHSLDADKVMFEVTETSSLQDFDEAKRFLNQLQKYDTNIGQLDVVAQEMGAAEPVRLDSQAKYAMLASGAGDLYFRLINADKPNYKEKMGPGCWFTGS